MNKLSKIFLVIIIVLIVALGIMTYLYLNALKIAKNNLESIIKSANEVFEANKRIDQLEKLLETEKGISIVTNSTPVHVVENPDVVNDNQNGSDNKILDIKRFPEKVSLKVLEETITKDGATLVITDENEEPYGYGEDFVLEVKKGDSWTKVEFLPDTIWKSLAYVPNDEGILTMKLDFKDCFGSLEDGIYRVVKTILGVNIYSNEFEIK